MWPTSIASQLRGSPEVIGETQRTGGSDEPFGGCPGGGVSLYASLVSPGSRRMLTSSSCNDCFMFGMNALPLA